MKSNTSACSQELADSNSASKGREIISHHLLIGKDGTQRYKQAGNTVTVNVIEAIARKLAKVR